LHAGPGDHNRGRTLWGLAILLAMIALIVFVIAIAT